MTAHANDIVAHYASKGLIGGSLCQAVERHRRVLVADPDVVVDLDMPTVAYPSLRKLTPRQELEARWAYEEAERVRSLMPPHPHPSAEDWKAR